MPRYDDREAGKNAEPELLCFESLVNLSINYQRENNRRWCKQTRKTLHEKTQRARNRNRVPPAAITVTHTQVTIDREVEKKHDQDVSVYEARHLYERKRRRQYQRRDQAGDWSTLKLSDYINDCDEPHAGQRGNSTSRHLVDTEEAEETAHDPER